MPLQSANRVATPDFIKLTTLLLLKRKMKMCSLTAGAITGVAKKHYSLQNYTDLQDYFYTLPKSIYHLYYTW